MLVTLRVLVQPQRRSEFLETMRGIVEPVRVERGCLSYRLYEDIEDRNMFILMEEWKTQQDVENHIRTDNQRLLLALMELMSEQPELQFNTVSHTAGMELMENVLKADILK